MPWDNYYYGRERETIHAKSKSHSGGLFPPMDKSNNYGAVQGKHWTNGARVSCVGFEKHVRELVKREQELERSQNHKTQQLEMLKTLQKAADFLTQKMTWSGFVDFYEMRKDVDTLQKTFQIKDTGIQTQMQQLQSSKTRCQQNISRTETNFSESNKRLDEMKSNETIKACEATKAEHSEEQRQLTTEIDQLTEKIKTLEVERKLKRAAKQNLQQSINTLDSKMRDHKSKEKREADNNQALETKVQDLRKQLVPLSTELDDWHKIHQDYKTKLEQIVAGMPTSE